MNILVRGYCHGHWQNLGLIWDKGNVVHHYTRENSDKSLVDVGDELGYSTTKFLQGASSLESVFKTRVQCSKYTLEH